jgi:hypothetical protein
VARRCYQRGSAECIEPGSICQQISQAGGPRTHTLDKKFEAVCEEAACRRCADQSSKILLPCSRLKRRPTYGGPPERWECKRRIQPEHREEQNSNASSLGKHLRKVHHFEELFPDRPEEQDGDVGSVGK